MGWFHPPGESHGVVPAAEVPAGVPPVRPLARVVPGLVPREPRERRLPRVEPPRHVVGVSLKLENREHLNRRTGSRRRVRVLPRLLELVVRRLRRRRSPATRQRAPPRRPVPVLRDRIRERALTRVIHPAIHPHQNAVQLAAVQPERDVSKQQDAVPFGGHPVGRHPVGTPDQTPGCQERVRDDVRARLLVVVPFRHERVAVKVGSAPSVVVGGCEAGSFALGSQRVAFVLDVAPQRRRRHGVFELEFGGREGRERVLQLVGGGRLLRRQLGRGRGGFEKASDARHRRASLRDRVRRALDPRALGGAAVLRLRAFQRVREGIQGWRVEAPHAVRPRAEQRRAIRGHVLEHLALEPARERVRVHVRGARVAVPREVRPQRVLPARDVDARSGGSEALAPSERVRDLAPVSGRLGGVFGRGGHRGDPARTRSPRASGRAVEARVSSARVPPEGSRREGGLVPGARPHGPDPAGARGVEWGARSKPRLLRLLQSAAAERRVCVTWR